MAVWKAVAEWGSRLHGDGEGDPSQPGDVGSGGANFDVTWQGAAPDAGSSTGNVVSATSNCTGGITSMTETKLEDTKVTDEQVTVTVTDAKGKTSEVSAELLLVATGRGPITSDLGYEDIGVKLDRGFVVPKSWDTLETDVEGVYAVGDLLPPPSLALAHASFAEGFLIAETVAGQSSPPIDYAGIPRVTFSTPEVASVGLTEAQAKEQGHEVVVNKFPFNATAKGLIHGQGGMVKVVAAKDGPVLGIHLVGARVTDLVAEAMLIYNWEALPVDVAQFIHPHPTLSEAVGEAHMTLAGRRFHQL